MFVLYANKTKLTLRQREPVTSGSVNVYPVRLFLLAVAIDVTALADCFLLVTIQFPLRTTPSAPELWNSPNVCGGWTP